MQIETGEMVEIDSDIARELRAQMMSAEQLAELAGAITAKVSGFRSGLPALTLVDNHATRVALGGNRYGSWVARRTSHITMHVVLIGRLDGRKPHIWTEHPETGEFTTTRAWDWNHRAYGWEFRPIDNDGNPVAWATLEKTP